MNSQTISAAFALSVALTGAAGAQDFMQTRPSTIVADGGEAVYNAICAACHAPGGAGAVGAGMYPALADNPNMEAPDYAVYLIINGQKAMPPVGDFMTDDQIAQVVNYIRHDLNGYEGDDIDGAAVAASR